MSGAADDIAGGIMAKWAAAFGRLDADALSSLYSTKACFSVPTRGSIAAGKGSRPISARCRDGVRAPFKFTDVVTSRRNPDLINVAGAASLSPTKAR